MPEKSVGLPSSPSGAAPGANLSVGPGGAEDAGFGRKYGGNPAGNHTKVGRGSSVRRSAPIPTGQSAPPNG